MYRVCALAALFQGSSLICGPLQHVIALSCPVKKAMNRAKEKNNSAFKVKLSKRILHKS